MNKNNIFKRITNILVYIWCFNPPKTSIILLILRFNAVHYGFHCRIFVNGREKHVWHTFPVTTIVSLPKLSRSVGAGLFILIIFHFSGWFFERATVFRHKFSIPCEWLNGFQMCLYIFECKCIKAQLHRSDWWFNVSCNTGVHHFCIFFNS